VIRVLLDATALPDSRGGVARYVDELVAHLPAIGVDLHVAAQPRDLQRYVAHLGADRVHPAPGWAVSAPARLAWEQVGLPRVIRAVAPDVVHSPHYTVPIVTAATSGVPQVVTFHDATFFSHPQFHRRVKAVFFRQWTRVAGRIADAAVVPSRATEAEVLSHARIRPDRVFVVPHGVDHEHFRPPSESEVEAVRTWLGIGPDQAYVAFLGTLEPRKNVPALVRAFIQVCGDRPDPPVLVLAGGRGWDDGIGAALEEVPEHLTVLSPGFVPDGLVPALLGGAEVVAYPAFGEGFGLPVLEAMACGAAVLTTRGLSLPEVGGDAVAYAGSPDVADLAVALDQLLQDGDRRAELGTAGVARAARYTWSATAAGHLAVYEKVLAG
jgi:glycosyltransferase involved in cell wall biosynthesis